MSDEEQQKMSLFKKILLISLVAITVTSVSTYFVWAELYKCESGLREITAEIMIEADKPGQISPLLQKHFEDKIVVLLQECPNDTMTLNWQNTICDIQGCYEGETRTSVCSPSGCEVTYP